MPKSFAATHAPRVSCTLCQKTFGAAGWGKHKKACSLDPAYRVDKYRKLKILHCAPHGRNIPFNLSNEDIQTLLDEAGITIFDVGRTSNEYVLARYNDTGPYEMGNCRYITFAENISEKEITEHHRETARNLMTNYWSKK